MIINIHAGHNSDNKIACGAISLIKESTENRNVVKDLNNFLIDEKHTVYDCTCDNGKSASDVINKIIAKCNSHNVDLDISIHFNCGVNDKIGNSKSTGVEVLVYRASGLSYETAKRICKEVEALGFKNRGVKVRQDLEIQKRPLY